jgi:hypothetical protein
MTLIVRRVWLRAAAAMLVPSAATALFAQQPRQIAQQPRQNSGTPAASAVQKTLNAAGQQGRFTFIVFSKEDTPAAQEMLQAVNQSAERRRSKAVVTTARVNDPAERELVTRFGIGRAPMPLTVAVAPNGAVTGIFPKKFTEDNMEAAIVTPTMTRCMRMLQDKKLVFVLVAASGQPEAPLGVKALQTDAQFRDRIVFATLRMDDPAEERFVKQMKLNPDQVAGPYAVLIAPPGVMVGHFDSEASAAQIAAAIHKSGQCCDDPNCKHNHQNVPPGRQAQAPAGSRKN